MATRQRARLERRIHEKERVLAGPLTAKQRDVQERRLDALEDRLRDICTAPRF